MIKIDTADISYELGHILPMAGNSTIERVVDLFQQQLHYHEIELKKQFEKHNETNRSRHSGCQKALFASSALLALALVEIVYLKGWF